LKRGLGSAVAATVFRGFGVVWGAPRLRTGGEVLGVPPPPRGGACAPLRPAIACARGGSTGVTAPGRGRCGRGAHASTVAARLDGNQPFDVKPLGQASVIQGWNQGLLGVKSGGVRELVIPAALGYGAQGSPPTIKPNETLIFLITVKSVKNS